jgi:hypothetical protein
VSRELYRLARPDSVNANDATKYYCGVIEHPNNGQVAIGPINDSQNVHAQADEARFGELISDSITSEERGAITGQIKGKRGGKVNMLDIIGASPSLNTKMKTREQLEQAGWFPTEEIA